MAGQAGVGGNLEANFGDARGIDAAQDGQAVYSQAAADGDLAFLVHLEHLIAHGQEAGAGVGSDGSEDALHLGFVIGVDGDVADGGDVAVADEVHFANIAAGAAHGHEQAAKGAGLLLVADAHGAHKFFLA